MATLTLPSLGEGIEKGTIITILVKVGDYLVQEQPIMEVETDKVVVEVPADAEGRVTEILVAIGDEISEGVPFIKLADDTVAAVETKEAADTTIMTPPAASTQPAAIPVISKEEPSKQESTFKIAEPPSEVISSQSAKFRASPLARKLAREIGINIEEVSSIAVNGRISVKDVKAYAKLRNNTPLPTSGNTPALGLPDFSKWGKISRQPLPAITQATSKNMTMAWSQIPHAWLQEKVDVTELEVIRQRHKGRVKEKGGALTMTSILVKVVAKALQEFPIFNVSLDPNSQEIIHKDYINIGVAVDSDRGLLVPVLKDVHTKGMMAISKELVTLSQSVRQKKTKPADLEGGTFTISNLGGIGTSAIFPLVNHPQVAILGVASSTKEAVWNDGAFQPRMMLPLTVAFDHRIINGADAARFLKYIKNLLEDWFLWGM